MEKSLDNFYLLQQEPNASCLLALRDIILSHDKSITAQLKYGMPFFNYKDKMFCYLWVHKKYKKPYIGIVGGIHLNHPDLLIEKRSYIKILLVDPDEDLPIRTIKSILKDAIKLHKF